jgi:endo-1,4-beta-D-glucanase Y
MLYSVCPRVKVVFAVYERERSNPSYHLPGFFEMFARVYKREGWAGDVVWAQAAIASRAFLKK